MFEMRTFERMVYKAPEINCEDYEKYPMVNEQDFIYMESQYYDNTNHAYLFPFVSTAIDGRIYIEIYIWGGFIYPKIFKRFIICNGYRMTEDDEQCYLRYIKEAEKGKLIVEQHMLWRFLEKTREKFPMWNLNSNVLFSSLFEILMELYFVSHRSGIREILYKAGLDNIAKNIDSISEYNILGTSPESIFNSQMPIRLLRLINRLSMVHYMFADDTLNVCIDIYKRFSSYIDANEISPAQWSYLEMLYFDADVSGRKFDRTLYNRLVGERDSHIVMEYYKFLDLKEKYPGINLKLPKSTDIYDAVRRLDYTNNYENNKILENRLVKQRSMDDSYEYSNDSYLVKMPSDGLEMCIEAIQQGNCLINYIEPHANAKTTIVFLRKRLNPNKPFVTVEIFDHKIVQAYGKYNLLPDKEVFLVLESYAKKKYLIFEPNDLIKAYMANMDSDENEVDDDIWDYLVDFKKRHEYPRFPYVEIPYHQLTIWDYMSFTENILEMNEHE